MHPYRTAPAAPRARRGAWLGRAVLTVVLLGAAWSALVSVLARLSAPWPAP